VLIAWLRRGLPETPSFEIAQQRTRGGARPERPWSGLRRHPGSLAAIVALAAPLGFVGTTALTFASKLLQQEHGYTPRDVTVLFVGAGLLLLPASLWVGALGDRFGRRPVLAVLLLLHAAGAAVFCTSAANASVIAGWLCMMLGWSGCEVLVSAVAAELFPTSCRVTATGACTIAIAIGGALGLWTESALAGLTGAHGAAILFLIPAIAIAVLAACMLPETAARELEEISRSE
jgi:MFS family permease